ncbi:CheR family methyltransferase [candidate division CSSED10-310 bacterium]|uniref:protein-glutamate O-methyltransferase n=1 Tax=candidate division CSSED10-310 bacterium TaxID=2855610 RepID=A0ABV6YTK6_UNCC1
MSRGHYGSKVDLTPAEYSRFRDLILARTGLYYPEKKKKDLERGLAASLIQANIPDINTLYQHLQRFDEENPLWSVVINALTIGETYFFRNKLHFKVLKEYILKKFIDQKNEHERTLRIWSAGCASGEEPYSIAILLYETLPLLTQWKIQIFGTDINKRFLARALEGTYGLWSFRKVDKEIMKQYFIFRDNEFVLRPEIKQMVTFQYLNLLRNGYHSIYSYPNMFDLIICRNVTIYFDDESIRKIMQNFYRSLLPGGWLLVGQSEPQPKKYTDFKVHSYKGALVFRKSLPFEEEKEPLEHPDEYWLPPARTLTKTRIDLDWPTSQTELAGMELPLLPQKSSSFLKSSVQASEDTFQKTAQHDLNEARELANQGKLDAGERICLNLLKKNRLMPEVYYLLAMIATERNQLDEAERFYKKTVYLKSDFVMAQFGLFNLYLSQGDDKQAQIYFDNTRELLLKLPANGIVPHSDNLTATKLLDIIDINF